MTDREQPAAGAAEAAPDRGVARGASGARARSLGALVSDLPRLVVELLKAELNHLKAEFAEKVKYAGVGIGLFAFAAFLLFFAFGTLVAAAVLGIAVALPAWAAALIVFGALVVIAVVLALVGVRSFSKMDGVAPSQTIASIKQDIDALKGLGSMTTDRSDVDRARAELAAAIDAIEYKLNVPKRTAERVQRLRNENPAALAALAVGTAVAVAGVVWGVVRLVRR